MSDNLPDKYKENIFTKIKIFFSKIFSKESKSEFVKNIQIITNPISTTSVFEQMKEESKKVHLKEDILKLIDDNPELIDTLSIRQLEELDKMYAIIIEENNRIINKLKRNLA